MYMNLMADVLICKPLIIDPTRNLKNTTNKGDACKNLND